MKSVRLGWIGLGRHTEQVMFRCLRNLPVEVAAVCDVKPERLEIFTKTYNIPAAYEDYKEMALKECLDAVVCIVEAQEHYDVAKFYAGQGAHVFIEKTPCLNLQQARELAEIQEKMGRYIMTGFNRRFSPGYIMAKEISSRDEFGRITMYLAKYNAGRYRSEDYYITNHIINHLDLARFLLGEIKTMSTTKVKVSDTQVGFNISFVAENGAIGLIQSGSLQHIAYPMERVEITGVGRNVIVDNYKHLEYNRPPTDKNDSLNALMNDKSDTLMWNLNNGWVNDNSFFGYEDEMRHFIKCVADSTEPSPSFADTLHTMELMDMFQKSIVV